MDIPGELRLLRDATARLLVDVADLDDAALAGDSSVAGWSRADVLRHLTDDALARAAAGATTAAANPAGATAAGGASAAVVADLASASEYLADMWAVRAPDAWGRRLDHMRRGPSRTMSEPAARLVEVVVHHVDLDMGRQPEDWPAEVVDVSIAHVMATLAQRHARVGGPSTIWRLGRTDAPVTEAATDPAAAAAAAPAGWMVVRAPYGSEVHPVAAGEGEADGDADAAVTGPGHSLLAWVLGRRPIEHPDLAVVGDAELAESFPQTYTY